MGGRRVRSAQEPDPSSDNQAVPRSAFRFRLERVRAVRERKEKLAQRELADAISRRSSSEADLRTADASLEHARAEQRTVAAEAKAVSATDLLARQAFLERVEAQRRLRARELEQREAEVAERDAELATAASEHEMLNRLQGAPPRRARPRGGAPRAGRPRRDRRDALPQEPRMSAAVVRPAPRRASPLASWRSLQRVQQLQALIEAARQVASPGIASRPARGSAPTGRRAASADFASALQAATSADASGVAGTAARSG